MSSTVTVGSMEVTSNESGADMVAALTPDKDEAPKPVLRVDKGEEQEQEPEKDEAAKAAAVLGKKGGEATAAKKAAEAKDQEKAAADDKKKGNPRHDPTARVTEATREAREAREEAARERAAREQIASELARERAGKAKPAAEQAKPTEKDADPKPNLDDYELHEDWVIDASRWAARQEQKEARRMESEERTQSERDASVHKTFDSFWGRLNEAVKADPEYKERTADFVGALQPTPLLKPGTKPTGFNLISDEIITSEMTAALVDHFVQNPDDLQRIAALQLPRPITRAMAKLETRLEAKTASDAVTAGTSVDAGWKPGAPPVRPVTGSAHTADRELSEDAPLSAFVARDSQRRLAERGR